MMSDNKEKPPERIYHSASCNGWSEVRESVHDIEYVRADLTTTNAKAAADRDAVSEALMELRRQHGTTGNPVPLPHNFHWAIVDWIFSNAGFVPAPCDYRNDECAVDGKIVHGVWRCNNHLPGRTAKGGVEAG
jgi:hypothetical protein